MSLIKGLQSIRYKKLSALLLINIFGVGCNSSGNSTSTDLLYSNAEVASETKIMQVADNLPKTSEGQFVLEIIHMNDIHSNIDPLAVTFNTPSGAIRVRIGGSEAEMNFINARRAVNPNLLVISAGDQIIGNAANYNMFKGRTDAALHGIYGTDYYIFGNHEFDHGGKGLAKFVNAMKELSPKSILLNTDIVVDSTNALKETGVPTHIREVNGKKVAFYGVTTSEKIWKSSKPDRDMHYLDRVAEVNKLSAKNNKETDIHVLVSHNGVLSDEKMVKELKDVDIIIGGDSHSLFGSFAKYGIFEEREYPVTVTNASGKKVCIVQANEYGKVIGDLQVVFDEKGDVQSCGGHAYMSLWADTAYYSNSKDAEADTDNQKAKKQILDIIAEVDSPFILSKPNPEVYKALDIYRQAYMADDKVIGKATEDLCTTRYPTNNCAIKNTIAIGGSESCQVFGQIFVSQLGTPETIFISNSGSYRVDVEKGDFSTNSLLALLPFANKIGHIKMKGSEIQLMLNEVVTYINKDVTANDGAVPCGYGYAYTMKSSGEDPVSDILVKDKNGNYVALDLDKEYDVLVSDYIKKGKIGYDRLKNYEFQGNSQKDSDMVKEYLENNGVLPKIPKQPTIRKFVNKE